MEATQNEATQNEKSFKEEFEEEWKNEDHNCCIMVSMIVSLIIYVGLIVGIFCSLKPSTLFCFITELFVMALLTLMIYLWFRFLGRIYSGILQEKKRLMSMKMDAYNNLLELQVKQEKEEKINKAKSDSEKEKEKQQHELELMKIELELDKLNCEREKIKKICLFRKLRSRS